MTTTAESTITDRSVNDFAVCALAAGILALVSMIGLGTPVPSAFAVGAGHVALHQLEQRGGQGRRIALTGLIIGYAVAAWGLALTLSYLPDLFTSN